MSFESPLAAFFLAALCAASPVAGQKSPVPPPTVLKDVRLSDDPEAPRTAIVLANGKIDQILGEGVPTPAGFRIVDAKGALAVPAFVDAYSQAGVETPEPVAELDRPVSAAGDVLIAMREANRKGLQPSLRALDVFDLPEEQLAAYREQGFAVLHASTEGQILGGTSTVTTLRSAALRDRVLVGEALQSASFSATGPGYPRTLMGRIAHLRQFLLDARWHASRRERYAAGGEDPRPPYDLDLEAIQQILRREQRLLCRADTARDIRRWLALARGGGFDFTLCGGREAWKVSAELLEAGVPVILDLDWGEEVPDPDPAEEESEEGAETEGETEGPSEAEEEEEEEEEDAADWLYREPEIVQRERRRRWEENRDCALRLHQAGVAFAFGTAGGSPLDLLEKVRTLVESGLPRSAALAALTVGGAEAAGVGSRVGRIEVGYDANIALWSDSPCESTANLEWLVVDGEVYEFEHQDDPEGEPAEGVNLTGTWKITYEDLEGPPSELELDMAADGTVKGTLSFERADGEPSYSEVTGRASGRTVTLESTVEISGYEARFRLDGTIEEGRMRGDATWKYSGGEDTSSFEGERKPPEEDERSESDGRRAL